MSRGRSTKRLLVRLESTRYQWHVNVRENLVLWERLTDFVPMKTCRYIRLTIYVDCASATRVALSLSLSLFFSLLFVILILTRIISDERLLLHVTVLKTRSF